LVEMNFEALFLVGLFFAGVFMLFWDLVTNWNEYFGGGSKED